MLQRFTFQTLCLLLIFNYSFAQSDTLKWYPGVKLKTNDFSIDPTTTHIFSDVIVFHDYTFQPTKSGKVLPLIHVYAMLNRKIATLPDSSENTLRYAQLLFDLSGYQSKLIKLKIFELGELDERVAPAKTSVDNAASEAHNEVSRLTQRMIEELSRSANEQTFVEWEGRVSGLLQATPEIVEEKSTGNLQLGLFIGVARSVFTGKTKAYFTDATGLDFGFNVDIKKSRLVLDLSLDFNKTKQELESKGNWAAGMKTHFASIEFTYGVKLAKNKWLAVPFAGLSINEFSPARSDREDKRRLNGFSPVAGFEINRYFGNKSDSRESASFFYKCRMSVSPSNFIKDYGGTQFNLKLAIGFDVSKVKRKLIKKI